MFRFRVILTVFSLCGAWAFGLVLPCSIDAADDSSSSTNPHIIDLPTALRLAGANSIDVKLARERMVEAEADFEAARMRFFPWLTPALGYRFHDGNVQAVEGQVFTTEKQSYTGGLGLSARVELGDAWYQRLAAIQMQEAAGHAADAQQLQATRRAALGWFDLAHAQAQVGVVEEAVRISEDYARQLGQAVEVGVAQKADQLRVQVQTERHRTALRQAQENQRIAAARLATILRLDPAVELFAPDVSLVPMTLPSSNESIGALVSQALEMRPELKQNEAMTGAALNAHKGSKYGPMIPTLQGEAFWGGMGGGRNGYTGNLDYTSDYFIGMSWKIGPGGLLDHSRVRKSESRLAQSELEGEQVKDGIIRQVVEAATRTKSRSDQLETSQHALTLAEETLDLSRERQQYGVAVVLEFIQSEQELTRARSELLEIIAEHNKAQYDLAAVIGELN